MHKTGYVATGWGETYLVLHRVIMDAKKGQAVDHINHNKLDNRKSSNLRICTQQENLFNRKTYSNNKSGYRGVSWDKKKKKWCAKIYVNGKNIDLGEYENKEDAVMVRRMAEKKYFGVYAPLKNM